MMLNRTPTARLVALATLVLLAGCARSFSILEELPPPATDAGVGADASAPPCAPRTGERWRATGGPGGGSVRYAAGGGEDVYLVESSLAALYRGPTLDGPFTRLASLEPLLGGGQVAVSAEGAVFLYDLRRGVLASFDRGASFAETMGLPPSVQLVGFQRVDGATLAVRVDGWAAWDGARWVEETPVPLPHRSLAQVARARETWWIRGREGALHRLEGGGWVPVTELGPATDVLGHGERVWVTGPDGVARSVEAGGSFSVPVPVDGAEELLRLEDGALLAVGRGGVLARSDDHGQTFVALPRPTAPSAPRVPARQRIVARGEELLIVEGSLYGRSVDGGRSLRWDTSPVPGAPRFVGETARGWIAESEDGRVHFRAPSLDGAWRVGPRLGADVGVTSVFEDERIEPGLLIGTRFAGVLALDDAAELRPVGAELPLGSVPGGSVTQAVNALVAVDGSLYTAVGLGGVFRLGPGSARWVPVNAGLPTTRLGDDVPARIVDALFVEGGRLWAAGGAGLYELSAESWRPVAPFEDEGRLRALGERPDGALVALGAGGDVTGASWGVVVTVSADRAEVTVRRVLEGAALRGEAVFGDEIWFWTSEGPVRSRDGGRSFAPVTDGLPARPAPSTGREMLTVTDAGLLARTREGVFALPVTCEEAP